MALELRSERLQISPLEVADLDAFVSYRQNSEVARFQSWESDFSREQGLELIQSQAGISFPAQGNGSKSVSEIYRVAI